MVFIHYKKGSQTHNENSLCHSNKLFCDLGILKLFDLMKLTISMIMFKDNNELLPNNLQQFFNVKYIIIIACNTPK